MDACHIVLERPWLYDKKVMYDGFKHVYSFEKDRHKLVLALLKLSLISKPSESRSLADKNIAYEQGSIPIAN